MILTQMAQPWALAVLAMMALARSAPPPNMLGASPAILAKAHAAYKFAGPAPLPLRAAREDWSGARYRAAKDPTLRIWVAGERAKLTSWTTHYGDRAEWIAGWGHDLIDKDGLPASWTPDMPEPVNRTPAERKVHGAWVFYVRSANIAAIGTAVRLWKLDGDREQLNWAARQLDLYADAYAGWPVQRLNGVSQMMGQSLDEATNGIALADAVRIIGDAVPVERRARWDRLLFAPMIANLQASNSGRNNIAVWQAAATAVLAAQIGDAVAYRHAIDGPNGIRAMLRRGVTSDYMWFEPSVGYNRYTQLALSTLFVYLSLTGRAAPLHAEMLLTQDMIAALTRMRFADGTLPARGDTGQGSLAIDPYLLLFSSRTMPLRGPALAPSWTRLLDPGIPVAPLPREVYPQVWRTSQMAMLQSGGWEAFTQWGQLSASHAQSDALSYELRFGGVAITAPLGTAAYGSQLFLTYLRTSAAHNQPIIDGNGQVRFGKGVLVSAQHNRIVASNSNFSQETTGTRTLALGSEATITTTIAPAERAPHRLGDLFNTPCAVAPVAPLAPVTRPVGEGMQWWKDTRAGMLGARWQATLDCQGNAFTLELTTDSPGRVLVSRAPNNTGALTRTALYFETNATRLTSTWRIIPQFRQCLLPLRPAGACR